MDNNVISLLQDYNDTNNKISALSKIKNLEPKQAVELDNARRHLQSVESNLTATTKTKNIRQALKAANKMSKRQAQQDAEDNAEFTFTHGVNKTQYDLNNIAQQNNNSSTNYDILHAEQSKKYANGDYSAVSGADGKSYSVDTSKIDWSDWDQVEKIYSNTYAWLQKKYPNYRPTIDANGNVYGYDTNGKIKIKLNVDRSVSSFLSAYIKQKNKAEKADVKSRNAAATQVATTGNIGKLDKLNVLFTACNDYYNAKKDLYNTEQRTGVGEDTFNSYANVMNNAVARANAAIYSIAELAGKPDTLEEYKEYLRAIFDKALSTELWLLYDPDLKKYASKKDKLIANIDTVVDGMANKLHGYITD